MENFLNLTIILVAFLMFFIFKKTKSYISWKGGGMILLLIYLLIIKFYIVGDVKLIGLRFDNLKETLLPVIIFTLLGTIILGTMKYKKKKFKVLK